MAQPAKAITGDLFAPPKRPRRQSAAPSAPAEGLRQFAGDADLRAYVAAHQARRHWFEVREVAAMEPGQRRRYFEGAALRRPEHSIDRLRADVSDLLNGR